METCKDCQPHWTRGNFGRVDGITLCPLHASAPDLLAALEGLLARVEGFYNASGVAADSPPFVAARAAIARARGAAEGVRNVRKAKGA